MTATANTESTYIQDVTDALKKFGLKDIVLRAAKSVQKEATKPGSFSVTILGPSAEIAASTDLSYGYITALIAELKDSGVLRIKFAPHETFAFGEQIDLPMDESGTNAIASEDIPRNMFQDKGGSFAPQTLPWCLVVPQDWAIMYPAGDSRGSPSRRMHGGALAHVESQKSVVCINQAGSSTDQPATAVDVDLRFAAVGSTLPTALNGQPISMELTEDDLEAATKGTVTKFFLLPNDLPSGDGRPSIGVLTMGVVTANQRKEVIDNLSKRGTFVADMVIRLSSANQEKPLEP